MKVTKTTSDKLNYVPSKEFAKKIKKIKTKDPTNYQRIKDKIDYLLKNPKSYDHELEGEKRCRYIKYIGRRFLRIVYTWCERCRKSKCSEINQCDNCDKKCDNTLIVFDIFYKHDAERLGY